VYFNLEKRRKSTDREWKEGKLRIFFKRMKNEKEM